MNARGAEGVLLAGLYGPGKSCSSEPGRARFVSRVSTGLGAQEPDERALPDGKVIACADLCWVSRAGRRARADLGLPISCSLLTALNPALRAIGTGALCRHGQDRDPATAHDHALIGNPVDMIGT